MDIIQAVNDIKLKFNGIGHPVEIPKLSWLGKVKRAQQYGVSNKFMLGTLRFALQAANLRKET